MCYLSRAFLLIHFIWFSELNKIKETGEGKGMRKMKQKEKHNLFPSEIINWNVLIAEFDYQINCISIREVSI